MQRKFLPILAFVLLLVVFSIIVPSQTSAMTMLFPFPTLQPLQSSVIHIQNTTTTQYSNQTNTVQIHTSGSGTVTQNLPTLSSLPTVHNTPTPTTKNVRYFYPTRIPAPTVVIKVTNTLTPTTVKKSPTIVKVSPTLTPTPFTGSTSDPIKTSIMNGINNYRHSLGLSSVQTSDATCSFAKIRAQEISTDFSHTGFENRIANHQLPYTTWTLVTENLAMTSNSQDVVNMWIASPGHAANMRKDTPYVCVEKYGNYYAYEGMRP